MKLHTIEGRWWPDDSPEGTARALRDMAAALFPFAQIRTETGAGGQQCLVASITVVVPEKP